MEPIKPRGASFYFFLIPVFVFLIAGGGCAGGSKPKAIEKNAKMAKADKQIISQGSEGKEKNPSVSTDSGSNKVPMAEKDIHTTGTTAEQSSKNWPAEEKRSERARQVPKPEVTHSTIINPIEKPSVKKVAEDRGPRVVLNFDNADLYAVINTIGELLGINYIVGPSVAGKVTINTAGGLHKKDLFPIFLKILEVNGLTAIKEGNLYNIVEVKDSPRMPVELRLSKGGEDVPPMDKIIIQIIPLQFISTGDMTALITPFISKGGTIVSDANSNTLIVIDKWPNIMKALRLVQTFDVNMFDKVKYKFYPLEHLEAEEVVAFLTDFTSYYEKAANVLVKFIALTRMNTLLVISTTPHVFKKVEEILQRVDVAVEEAEQRIYVYFVKNGEAKDLGALVGKIFGKGVSDKDGTEVGKKGAGTFASISGNPFSAARMAEKKAEKAASKAKKKEAPKKTTTPAKGEKEVSGTLTGEVKITVDNVRNALIIEATPPDYRLIENLLKQIDVLPRQVLIEATIAEITVNTSTELGMEWALGKGAAAAGAGSFSATINKLVGTGTDAAYSGLKYSIGVTDKWYAALHALASEGKVNILSSPHVLASDNKEARIDVSREIPIASGTTNIAASTVVAETTIEYRDTGVILAVTPHINEQGLVTMDISEEVSDLEKKSINVAGKDYPAFFKRTVNTTLTVKHGQTIAIGGLIKDKEDEGITGVPCLIKIPVVRYLFGEWSKDVEKIELIVLITPRVVTNLDDVDAVTDEFKQKVRNVMKRFYPQ
ncbi:MAG: type II secretion system secretin GspD [Deltaproteobacteria bacterium]|nr:type II secretion system secretin GspD [Deltaproteobacteria bacterium]